MSVVYIGEKSIDRYEKGKVYEVLDIIVVQGEEYYLTDNNSKDKIYYKSILFKKVEEV